MTKAEIMRETLNYLRGNPHTQVAAIHDNIQRILRARGEIGEITTGNQYMSSTRNVRISDSDAMLINEVIYDLIVDRVLTPGVNADNLNWPFLSVTSELKLSEYLKR